MGSLRWCNNKRNKTETYLTIVWLLLLEPKTRGPRIDLQGPIWKTFNTQHLVPYFDPWPWGPCILFPGPNQVDNEAKVETLT